MTNPLIRHAAASPQVAEMMVTIGWHDLAQGIACNLNPFQVDQIDIGLLDLYLMHALDGIVNE